MKKLTSIIMIIALCLGVVGCGKSETNVFQGEKAAKPLIKQRTTTIFSSEDGSTPESTMTLNYNEKGLLESKGYEEKTIPVYYSYDEQGSPASITIRYAGENAVFPITNIYEGKTVKEARVDLKEHAQDFPADFKAWDSSKVGYLTSILDDLENCVNYRDTLTTITGTPLLVELSNGETVRKCLAYADSLQETEWHTEEDGTSWMRTTYNYGDGQSIQTTFYDSAGRITRTVFSNGTQDNPATIYAYSKDRDPDTGHTIYKALLRDGSTLQYEFAEDRMLVMDYELYKGIRREVTTYTEDGQIAVFEQYMDGTLSRSEEYEYR